MNKSVVVMETPEDCESCVLHGGIFHSFWNKMRWLQRKMQIKTNL